MRADSGLRLTSSANPLLKTIRKAARRGRATAEGLWLAESPHLLDEAVDCGAEIQTVVLADRSAPASHALAERSGAPIRLVSDEIFDELATTEHSQGVLALVRPKTRQINEIVSLPGPLLILDQVADPGNVGAIARSAEAFGAAGLLLTKGCAWPDNPKTLRASAGALFRLPIVAGLKAEAALAACAEAGRPLLAAAAHGARPWSTPSLRAPQSSSARRRMEFQPCWPTKRKKFTSRLAAWSL
ncbi:MAG: RNA methyltransferase [Bryobacterales bacterium]